MFSSVEKEPKKIKELLKKVLEHHFDTVLTKPIPAKTKCNNVMKWIEKTNKSLIES